MMTNEEILKLPKQCCFAAHSMTKHHFTNDELIDFAQRCYAEGQREVSRRVYEVWAGSEGIPEPITCSEAYLLQLVMQMRDEAKVGL